MADAMTSSSGLERKMQEKYRRQHMKYLLESLAPLVHPQPSKLSMPEVVDQATSYVKHLQERIEKLKQRLVETIKSTNNMTSSSSSSRIPVLNIRSTHCILEVNLVCGLKNKHFMLHEIINVLQEEGAQVISLTYRKTSDESIIYAITSQAISLRIGMEVSKIQERLKELIFC